MSLKCVKPYPHYKRKLLGISKVPLAAKHLPEPRGNRCCGNLGLREPVPTREGGRGSGLVYSLIGHHLV